MAAVDAQFYWMSAKVRNDDFMLYAFDGEAADLERTMADLRRRASESPDLAVRVRDGAALTYPQWVPAEVGPDWVVHRDAADAGWDGCLSAVAGLAENQLDMREMPWRIHIFAPVLGIPGARGPGTVAVMQVPHALADGVRASELAAWLFGRPVPVPEVRRPPKGFLPWRAFDAARTHRLLVRDTRAGRLAPGVGYRPPLSTNARPDGARSLRMLVRHRSQLQGPTVTVAALSAVSAALSAVFGGAADSLGAEVPMTKPGVRQAHNHFGNVVVGLYPRLDRTARMQQIAADLSNGRRRFEHPAVRSADRAFAAMPAPLLRWGVSLFDPDVRPVQVLGNTVVSSVNRGPADLEFGGAPVILATACPTLGPAMSLTHGVHGIGEIIAVSVHAAESAVQDVDAYVARLDAAL
ncbi:DUF1298 domain-containing protein [Mycobacterium shigaense]|uniref:DUF1298 domain-containing protein n=2 Tax=Mycobacterium shigaense TaxID=722731 RepID=A0A1Z4EM99_9MYCO|nr:DUF1298 domain-containing protein [Mycobacterium shigaense]BAX94016.1 DUF1298 domain-containing protein [Mycobacterium shigaense]